MLADPLLRNRLNSQAAAQLLLTLMAIMFDLTDLFDHACAKQGVLINEGDADQILTLLLTAPGNDTWITGMLAK